MGMLDMGWTPGAISQLRMLVIRHDSFVNLR